MLYSIIPPILVILSLAGIIIFLAKKAPQVARLDDEDDLEMEQARAIASAGFFQRIAIRIKNISWAGIGQMFLAIFENITRKAKMMFTNLEGKSKNLSDSIKSKRMVRRVRKVETDNAGIENNEDADIINRIEKYHQKNRKNNPEEEEIKIVSQNEEIVIEEEEKIIRPTVSRNVVKPKNRAEMKDRLENLLIERIAANPKDIEAYERLGEYYMEIDSLMDAKECFKQVLKLDSKNENVKYRMKRLEAMLHKR